MSALADLNLPLNIKDIMDIIPHRYPFLLIERVTQLDDKVAAGHKNVSMNEPFFQGHFPGEPIMPGVLIMEALAQLGCVQLLVNKGCPKDQIVLFAGMDKVKFRRPVVPGDRLDLHTELIWEKRGLGKSSVKATVDGELAASAELMFALVNKDQL